MKIIIDTNGEIKEEYISFHIYEVTDRISKVISYIENVDTYLVGKNDERLYKVKHEDILYIETVDKKSFLYTKEEVYALSEKLYQLEEKLQFADFIRISKSMILNIDKILSIYPTISGRFEARLENEEKVSISRSYTSKLKVKIGLGKEAKS